MTFSLELEDARAQFPEYVFVEKLTPSAQKAAFHVRDAHGQDLCLKIVAPTYERDRLDREIRAMQTIDHPNVVHLREYTFTSRPGHQRHFIVEEFVAGSDLTERLRPGAPWAIDEVARFFGRLCDGLAALKEKGIVHRDIKPPNIRVRSNRDPVIIDFGLARHLGLPDLTKTLQGARLGTPAYFAPEQFDGNRHEIDHRTDLFAVGILLYQAATGVQPFIDSTVHTVAQLRDAVCERDDHLRRSQFTALDRRQQILIGKLLEKQRAKRPAEASQGRGHSETHRGRVMRRGAWHQCGDRSQRLVREQLEAGRGVGVILSPRDLTRKNAIKYAAQYAELGAPVLLDPQFYVPDFSNDNLDTYGLSRFRTSLGALGQVTDGELEELARELEELGAALRVSGVIAPAAMYEAGRPDIVALNGRLFGAGKRAGDALGVPTLASVTLAQSAASSDTTVAAAVGAATSMDPDGWYYAFEFREERIPSGRDAVRRCCDGGLSLALTGKPILHAYAGPMCLLSYAFGATGVGIGHSQNLWRFTRQRWEVPRGQGGGGDAPARFFSKALWGTVVYPDETQLMGAALRSRILTPTSYCGAVMGTPPTAWSRWDAGKHLAWIIREDGDSGGDTGASVWYKRCVHKRLAATETPA